MNIPSWAGANDAYSRLYDVLEELGEAAWKKAEEQVGHRICHPPHPTAEMTRLVAVLERGDENEVRALQMHYQPTTDVSELVELPDWKERSRVA